MNLFDDWGHSISYIYCTHIITEDMPSTQHTHLSSTAGSFPDAEAEEDRVGHLDQDVIHTVDVDVLYTSLYQVIHDSSFI